MHERDVDPAELRLGGLGEHEAQLVPEPARLRGDALGPELAHARLQRGQQRVEEVEDHEVLDAGLGERADVVEVRGELPLVRPRRSRRG